MKNYIHDIFFKIMFCETTLLNVYFKIKALVHIHQQYCY